MCNVSLPISLRAGDVRYSSDSRMVLLNFFLMHEREGSGKQRIMGDVLTFLMLLSGVSLPISLSELEMQGILVHQA